MRVIIIPLLSLSVGGIHSSDVDRCEFDVEPVHVGHFWDPSCADHGGLGCNADGRNMNCRFCGAAEFLSVPCPSSACSFPDDPYVSFFWDPDCEMGEFGCWADGVHKQCRFCGDYPYTGVPCPGNSTPAKGVSCAFMNEPAVPYYWDPFCELGMHGCNADGIHVHCRYCGAGEFVDVRCPASEVCDFDVQPSLPYYWDPTCHEHGGLGCNADGVHTECRYCAHRPFESVPCPEPLAPPKDSCKWPLRGEPNISHFWDESCTMGMLGCWADGVHAQCRFCGSGVFSDIECLDTSIVPPNPMVDGPSILPMCIAGTTNVYQPSPSSGKCYCGNPKDEVDKMGYCMDFLGQISAANCSAETDSDDPRGQCGYYCMCGGEKDEISCCMTGSSHALVGNVITEKPRRLRGIEYV